MEGGEGKRGREKEVGELQGPFSEEGRGVWLRPREGEFRAEEGEQEGDPARPSGSPTPHPGLGGGCRGSQSVGDSGWGRGGGAVKVRSLPAQAKGGRQQLPIPILEATVAETGTVTCPRSQSRRLRLSGGLEAAGQGFFRDALIPSQL